MYVRMDDARVSFYEVWTFSSSFFWSFLVSLKSRIFSQQKTRKREEEKKISTNKHIVTEKNNNKTQTATEEERERERERER